MISFSYGLLYFGGTFDRLRPRVKNIKGKEDLFFVNKNLMNIIL